MSSEIFAAICFLILFIRFSLSTTAGSPKLGTDPEDYSVSRFSVENGLPQNSVRALLQTTLNGYLWIGTSYGLARFDGARMVDFSPVLLAAGAHDLTINYLVEDSDHTLWIHTRGNDLFGLRSDRLDHFVIDPIWAMAPCRAGGLWLSMEGGLRHFINGKVEDVSPPGNASLGGASENIIEDSDGGVWLSPKNSQKQWLRFEPRNRKIRTLEDVFGLSESILALFEDRQKRYWLSTSDALLCFSNGKTQRYPGRCPPLQFKEGQDGSLWLISGQELIRFKDGEFTHFDQSHGLSDTDLRCLHVDRESNVWLGTGSAGLNLLKPRRLTTVLSEDESGKKLEVFSLSSEANGRVWIGTSDGLFAWASNSFEKAVERIFDPTVKQFQYTFRPVLVDHLSRVWFGAPNVGLYMLEGTQAKYISIPGLDPVFRPSISCLTEDMEHQLWIGTTGQGVFVKNDARTVHYTLTNGLPSNQINSIVSGENGTLWIGTVAGLSRLQNGHFETIATKEGLLNDQAWIAAREQDDTLWVGTPSGLNRVRDGQIRSVSRKNGLFDDLAYTLLDDGIGNFWSYCNRGIWRVRKADLHAVADGRTNWLNCISFGVADGMIRAEGNGDWQPGVVQRPDGSLCFPTICGAAMINPRTLVENEVPPAVVIERVKVDDEIVQGDWFDSLWGDSVRREANRRNDLPSPSSSSDARDRSPLRLPPGRARVLEIRYTANSFVAPEKVRFRYCLEGWDREWRDANSSERSVFYTNLRPGAYTFHVKACNNHGVWNETGAFFAFSLAPHFYQTPFAYVLGALLLGGTIFGAHEFRIHRQRELDHLRHQLALERERARIAQDMHDDLGASLSEIALSAEIVSGKLANPTETAARLGQISTTARTVISQLGELVWAINPRHDILDDCLAYTREYLVRRFEGTSLRCQIKTIGNRPSVPVTSEFRRNLFLVIKEAANNIARHADANEANFSFEVASAWLNVTISDNGNGFKPDVTNNFKNGLRNMRARVTLLRGEFGVASTPGQGVTIIIRVPLA